MAENERSGLNMTSMIDVVFLLLTFFMLNLSFPAREKTMSVNLPGSGTGNFDPSGLSFLLEVRNAAPAGGPPAAEITLQGTRIGADFDLASRRLRKWYEDVGNPNVPVVIDVDPSLPYRFFIRSLDATSKAGARNVKFAGRVARG